MASRDGSAGSERPTEAARPDGLVGELRVQRGTCYVLFAYDLGLTIDLDAAQRRITADQQRQILRHKRRAPYYFAYQPAPVRVTQSAEPVALGRFATEPSFDAVLYDFGAVSVQYSIPLAGTLTDLRGLADELYHNQALLNASRRVVEDLMRAIGTAVDKPCMSELVEDYAIYQIEALEAPASIDDTIRSCGLLLAQILRAESAPLSTGEVTDALACRISFGPDDCTLVDWNAALLFDRDADDVRAVLELANVELLEMRYLDDRLDAALDQAYRATFRRARRMNAFWGSTAADLSRIAELQTDSAVLYEGVNNVLKLLGDQYLARVHRLVSQRFHLHDWDQSILRKLQTIESIYDKISDEHSNKRMELLEWIIILLIALEILMPFIPALRPH
jgi:hypothetical protein